MIIVKREPLAIIAATIPALLALFVSLGTDVSPEAAGVISAGATAAFGVGASLVGVVKGDRITAGVLAGAVPAVLQLLAGFGLTLSPEAQAFALAAAPFIAGLWARGKVSAVQPSTTGL